MKILFKKDVCLSYGMCRSKTASLKFKHINSRVHSGLENLIVGCEENDFADIFEESEDLIYFYCYLEELKKNGFLQYRTSLLDLVPFDGSFVCQKKIAGTFSLSRFTLCRMDQERIILETPLCGSRAHLTKEGLNLMHILCKPNTVQDVIQEFPQFSYQELYETFCLLLSGCFITSESQESMAMDHWEFHDLFFHSRSREGRTDQSFGGTFRFKDKHPPLPAIKSCNHSSWVPLDRPIDSLQISLEQVMDTRKSIREYSNNQISIKQLGEFLWRSARIKSISATSEELTSRPYPGGGARYELELYLIITACKGIAPGVYHYHPLEHQLGKISDINLDAQQLLLQASNATGTSEKPQILFQISACFQRVFWKYQGMGYSLILKDVGVLIQTMYLVATAMQLAPCAIGSGNSDLFCKLTGTSYFEETSVGEFMLGSL